MADPDSDNDSIFGGYIDVLVENNADEIDLGDTGQTVVSVSPVHTADLSDFSELSMIGSESESDSSVDSDAEWTDVVDDFDTEPFREEAGPKLPLGLDTKPLEYFLLLFSENLFGKIVTETDRYAQQEGDVGFFFSEVK